MSDEQTADETEQQTTLTGWHILNWAVPKVVLFVMGFALGVGLV